MIFLKKKTKKEGKKGRRRGEREEEAQQTKRSHERSPWRSLTPISHAPCSLPVGSVSRCFSLSQLSVVPFLEEGDNQGFLSPHPNPSSVSFFFFLFFSSYISPLVGS
jgi:hypothetical protein